MMRMLALSTTLFLFCEITVHAAMSRGARPPQSFEISAPTGFRPAEKSTRVQSWESDAARAREAGNQTAAQRYQTTAQKMHAQDQYQKAPSQDPAFQQKLKTWQTTPQAAPVNYGGATTTAPQQTTGAWNTFKHGISTIATKIGQYFTPAPKLATRPTSLQTPSVLTTQSVAPSSLQPVIPASPSVPSYGYAKRTEQERTDLAAAMKAKEPVREAQVREGIILRKLGELDEQLKRPDLAETQRPALAEQKGRLEEKFIGVGQKIEERETAQREAARRKQAEKFQKTEARRLAGRAMQLAPERVGESITESVQTAGKWIQGITSGPQPKKQPVQPQVSAEDTHIAQLAEVGIKLKKPGLTDTERTQLMQESERLQQKIFEPEKQQTTPAQQFGSAPRPTTLQTMGPAPQTPVMPVTTSPLASETKQQKTRLEQIQQAAKTAGKATIKGLEIVGDISQKPYELRDAALQKTWQATKYVGRKTVSGAQQASAWVQERVSPTVQPQLSSTLQKIDTSVKRAQNEKIELESQLKKETDPTKQTDLINQLTRKKKEINALSQNFEDQKALEATKGTPQESQIRSTITLRKIGELEQQREQEGDQTRKMIIQGRIDKLQEESSATQPTLKQTAPAMQTQQLLPAPPTQSTGAPAPKQSSPLADLAQTQPLPKLTEGRAAIPAGTRRLPTPRANIETTGANPGTAGPRPEATAPVEPTTERQGTAKAQADIGAFQTKQPITPRQPTELDTAIREGLALVGTR